MGAVGGLAWAGQKVGTAGLGKDRLGHCLSACDLVPLSANALQIPQLGN